LFAVTLPRCTEWLQKKRLETPPSAGVFLKEVWPKDELLVPNSSEFILLNLEPDSGDRPFSVLWHEAMPQYPRADTSGEQKVGKNGSRVNSSNRVLNLCWVVQRSLLSSDYHLHAKC